MTSDRAIYAAAALLVATHLLLGFVTISRTSVTIDEFAHVPAGHATWKTGDPRLDEVTPPLFRTLAFGPPLDWLGPAPRLRFGGGVSRLWEPKPAVSRPVTPARGADARTAGRRRRPGSGRARRL